MVIIWWQISRRWMAPDSSKAACPTCDRVSTNDKLEYATEQWFKNSQNFLFYKHQKNFEITLSCALAKVVIMMKHNSILVYLSFV